MNRNFFYRAQKAASGRNETGEVRAVNEAAAQRFLRKFYPPRYGWKVSLTEQAPEPVRRRLF